MVTCPVCEHQQDFGFECDVCGKDLGGLADLGLPPAAVVAVEGLEVTVPERIGEVAVERVGELEVTRYSPVQVAPDVTPDLELSRMADVGEVAVERVADLSVDRVPDDGVRTAAPTGPITCRYCQQVNAEDTVLCARCGFRLPRAAPTAQAMAGKKKADVTTRCRSCGAPAKAGERCGDCGRDVPFPDP
jgi:hypothetical protein